MSLKKRIIEIAYKNKLSHLGSYLSSVDIIDKIYKTYTFLFLLAIALPTATVIPIPKLPVEQYIPLSSSL